MTLDDIAGHIVPPDRRMRNQAQSRLDRLTKPPGSLGRLEELAAQYVMLTGTMWPSAPRAAIVTFAADHGVAAEGVSAYPQEVTAQMLRTFARGGAGINVLAKHVGAEIRVVDIGVRSTDPPPSGVIDRRIAPGTANLRYQPAMTRAHAQRAVDTGIILAQEAAQDGVRLLGTGDMGIGNTTASAAVTAVMTGEPVARVTGHGTGVDDAAWRHKVAVIEDALRRHAPTAADPLGTLAAVGGFEIAGIAGLCLGGAAHRIPVVLDGFISGAAALIAVGMAPGCREYLIASHRSVECGHEAILTALQLTPLLDLQLRLGEGTGACLGIGLMQAALKIYLEMATFDEAGVSDAERKTAPC